MCARVLCMRVSVYACVYVCLHVADACGSFMYVMYVCIIQRIYACNVMSCNVV